MVGSQDVKKRRQGNHGHSRGDIRDIGKDIVVFMLDINGFEVLDLGIDVPVGVRGQDSRVQAGVVRLVAS
jgi:methanogenic corrinoid protein MtbC1